MSDADELTRSHPPSPPVDIRKRALISLALTLLLAVGAWFGLERAADAGRTRLEAYDRVREACRVKYAAALNNNDSVLVDQSPISEVLDNGVASAPKRCADVSKPPANKRN